MIKNIRELEEYLNISNDPPEGSRECFNELIDKLEKQKQEIEKLKIQLKTQKGFSYFVYQQILEDYISKDKIRDKIKKLKIECNICELGKAIDCNSQCTIGGTIKALKELLEE